MGGVLFLVAAVVLLYGQAVLGGLVPTVPDVGPVLAVYLGLFVRRGSIPLLAGAVGVLRAALDLEPMGAMILIHLAIAMFVSVCRDVLYGERLATQLVVTFAAGVGFVALQKVGAAVLPGAEDADGALFQHTVSVCFGTLVAPVVFFALRAVRAGPPERVVMRP